MKLLLAFLRWTLILLLALLLLGGGGGYLWLRSALPRTSGAVQVAGVTAPVEIIRDRAGVPHIRAANEADALFGLGYVHAQDRLWQMEFQRRVGHGRLSEVLGATTLETDKFLRTLGPARAAASAWQTATPEARAIVEAYVAGINAVINTHHGRKLPIEFTILGFAPEPWQPVDVLVWGKMMAWDLGGNWDQELLRLQLETQLGPERAAELLPAYLADGPIILPADSPVGAAPRATVASSPTAPVALRGADYTGLLAINRTLQESLGMGGEHIGSNNWVIGGAHTATGQPLLANDPHLGAQIPSIWYLAHISGGAINAVGATLPGVPGIIIGHNEQIAWGVTNTGPDVQDLFIERINERNEVEYRGQWEPMQIVEEVIQVKEQPAVTIEVRITRHGPLISDVLDDPGDPLAFRWTALDPVDATLDAFVQINQARNWEDFTAALANYHSPMQNFVYADRAGNIGYYAPGALPIRAAGDGARPVPGWSGDYDWTGYVPFEQLPHAYNPAQGYIVSANNQAVPADYPYLVSTTWAAPYRAARIVEMIESRDQITLADMAAMQADVTSAQARALLPYLLTVEPRDEQARAALQLLRNWDGALAGDSAAAAVYTAWYLQLAPHLFADELGPELWKEYRSAGNAQSMVIAGLPAGRGVAWCDNVTTPETESCPEIFSAALSAGLAEMATYQGSADLNAWRWDRVHHAVFPHTPFDSVDALRPLFSRSIPNGGDRFTVNVAPVALSDRYNQRHVPSYRHIVDLNDIDASRYIHSVGQSGHLLSRHYADLMERWQRVEYLPMHFSPSAIDAAAAQRLVLTP